MNKVSFDSDYLEARIPCSLLDAVCEKIEDNDNEITDDDIAILYSVFGKTLEKSFEMIDKKRFELVTVANQSDRSYVVVHGSSGIYTLYPNVFFCQCCAFKFSTSKKKFLICKHILGSRLALSMKKCSIRTSKDFIYHNMEEKNVL